MGFLMRIIEFPRNNSLIVRKAAVLLVEGFRVMSPDCWDTIGKALNEVRKCVADDRVCLAAMDESNDLIGWIGAIEDYHGRAWELHPLVVKPDCQGKGIGRALVEELEKRVCELGSLTLWLGTDDENQMTSLGGSDLFPNVLEKLCNIKNLKKHPFSFYLKCGFEIIGVMPNVDGYGKHDILMAKSVIRENEDQ